MQLYSKTERVPFNGTGDALNFISTIEARTKIGFTKDNDCRANNSSRSSRLVSAVDPVIYDMIIITCLEFKEQFLRYFYSFL